MASTITQFDALLKTRYTDKKVEDLTMAENVAMGLITKDSSFSGKAIEIPIIYGRAQGLAASSLAAAQSATSNSKSDSFTLTVGDYYGSVSVGDKVIEASRDNPGAFLRNKVVEIDGLYSQAGDDLDIFMHGNGGFALAQQSGAPSTNDITLSDSNDAVNLEVGMTVEFSTTDGTSGAVKSGSTTISAINRETGVVSLASAAAIDGGTGPVDGDYIFRAGTHGQTSGVSLVNGFGAYIAASGTAIPNLYGLVRSADPTRLGGCRVPSALTTGKTIEERAQILGDLMVGRYKGKGGDTMLLNPEDWTALSIALQSRGVRPAQDDSTRFGYMALTAVLGGKMVKIYPDRHQPKGLAFLLRMNTWTLWSMGKLLHPIESDGLTILRAATTNDYEYRLISYPALACNAPGWNGRVSLT